MKKNTQKGFTLVELLVVIAILAILASVSVVGYTAFINKAELSNAQTEAAQISDIISSALIGNDYVIVADGIYTTDGEEFVTEAPEGDKVADLTDDLASFASKLSVDNGVLVYTYSDKAVVNAMTGEKIDD